MAVLVCHRQHGLAQTHHRLWMNAQPHSLLCMKRLNKIFQWVVYIEWEVFNMRCDLHVDTSGEGIRVTATRIQL